MNNEPAATTRRIPDAAIAAFTMVCLVAMVTNPVSLEFLGDVFLPVFQFLGQIFVALAHGVVTAWGWITPW